MATPIRRLWDRVTDIFEPDITRVARFVTVSETVGGFTLPGELLNDRHILGLNFPGVVAGERATLFFRVQPLKAPARFQVRVNTTDVVVFTFDDAGGPQTWHEILPPHALKPENNELTFAVIEANASVRFSDVVFLYHSDQTTVKGPGPVLSG